MRLDDGLHPDERLDVRGEAVRHEVELAVWGDEGDGAVVLEPAVGCGDAVWWDG